MVTPIFISSCHVDSHLVSNHLSVDFVISTIAVGLTT